MKYFRFKAILLEDGWLSPGIVGLDATGAITFMDNKISNEKAEEVDGYAVPGFQNAHSHAFQYAMAGISENFRYEGLSDDFWGWRETMYRIAQNIGPEEMENIAGMLYSEMLRHGYTHVAEFHYIHHDQNGNWYENPAELGTRLIAAAKTAGIKITLVPVFYQKGGFGMEPNERQKRFICKSIEDYHKLWVASKEAAKGTDHASIGFGIHSLRAVEKEMVSEILKSFPKELPFHIHISEQIKEVEDAIPYLGGRPVEWLLNEIEVNKRCHFIHATHLSNSEVENLAKSGAHVVLCPSTEGNLGDGIFRFHDYKRYGGSWAIGTDSHVGLNPLEELRLLDYGQRLISHQRSSFITSEFSDSGISGFHHALTGGRNSMGVKKSKYFEKGKPFDAVVYHADHPLLANTKKENLMSTIVYSGDSNLAMGTIVDGEWIVKEQKHKNSEENKIKFLKSIEKLKIR